MKEILPQSEHPLFGSFATSINDIEQLRPRDAELYLTQEGFILNAEGWYHPDSTLVGEVIYVPDNEGPKNFFGQNYRKVTLRPNTFEPISYDQREEKLAEIDPFFRQSNTNPFFARYKQLIPQKLLHSKFTAKRAFQELINRGDRVSENFERDIESFEQMLGIRVERYDIGVTGSLSLGSIESIHDFDILFQGNTDDNLIIAKRIRDLVKKNPSRRVIEGGKGWNIRFYNERDTLMCCFFGYSNSQDAPLFQFEMDVIEEDVEVEGSVSEDKDSIYTPSILGLQDVSLKRVRNFQANEKIQLDKLIIYHTATRGECFNGDYLIARGALVKVKTPNAEFFGLCVIDRDGVRNLTPNWPEYYKS